MLSRVWLVRAMVLVSGAFAAGFFGWSALAEQDARPRRQRVAAAPPPRPAPVRDELARADGPKIVTRMASVRPSARLLRRVRRGQVGGVILFADNVRSPAQVARATDALQAAAARSAAAFRALLSAARVRPGWRRQIGESAQRIRSLKAQVPRSR